MAELTITTLTNDDKRFYPWVGPFLSRRKVVKAVGDTIWDDDAKTWFVARRGRTTLGFCAVTATGKAWWVESLYTVDGHESLHEPLVAAAVAFAGGHELRAVVRPAVVAAYQAAGFLDVGAKGHFVKLHRSAKAEP